LEAWKLESLKAKGKRIEDMALKRRMIVDSS
jgi:hypothetical protein